MTIHRDHTRRRRFEQWLGSILQGWAWYLHDPHDSWMIDYRNERGRACAVVSKGRYRIARMVAKNLGGKIVGHRVASFPDGGVGVEP